MNIKRGLAALFTTTVVLGATALPSSAQTSAPGTLSNHHSGGGYSVPVPTLLTNTKMDWAQGSSEWVNLSWTSKADLTNVRVYVVANSKGIEVEYPSNQNGYTSLLDNNTLSSNEIDFTSVKLTTDTSNSGTKKALVYIRWSYEGRTYQLYAGRLQLTNKKYKGDDFAILTESASVSSDPAAADKNWVEFNYKGLAPRTTNMAMTVESDLDVYYPQQKFTSLHHDETLHSGETDVARIWLDPELLESGQQKLVVNISYRDVSGQSKTESHVIELTID